MFQKQRMIKKEVKTKIKKTKLIDKRRKQIIDSAIKIFTSKGFHKATVKEIADSAGLSMGSLYNYIRTKQDIIYMVYDYVTQVLRDEMKEAIEGITDPDDRLKAALFQNLRAVHENQDLIMFLYKESASLDKESLYTVLARETDYIELFEQLLRERFKGKPVDEEHLRLAADLLSYIPVIMSFRRWSLGRRFKSMDKVLEGIADFTLSGIEFIVKAEEA